MAHLPPKSSAKTQDTIRRLVALAWNFRAKCLYVLFLQVAMLALGLSGLNLTGVGIDYLRHQMDPAAPEPSWPLGIAPPENGGPMLVIGLLAGLILGLAVARTLLNYIYALRLADLVEYGVVANLRVTVYEKMQRLSFRFFDENASGSIINRVTSDVQRLRMFIDGVLLQGFIMALSLMVYVGYMANLSAGLMLACLATTPMMLLASSLFSRHIRPSYARNRELNDRLVLDLAESFQGAQVIKSFGLEEQAKQRYQASNDAVRDQQKDIFFWVSVFSPSMGLLSQINLIILLAYGGWLVIQGHLPLGGGLIVFAGLLQQFSTQVTNLAGVANTAQESLAGARRVFEILDAPIEIQSAPDPIRLQDTQGRIAFEQVSFHYRPDATGLRDISFTIKPGDCAALLGPLGSGKSTLLGLLPRFYDPTSGRITLDGHDLRDVALEDLRRRIGIVFQDNFLFSTTVAKNIAFGHPDASRDQVERAARIASAHDFILALPKGYDTILGEMGVGLSGGQRQRLAIARALLLDPPILLLDDPLAAVDAETEHEILAALENAIRGRTVFIATHRLSTIVHANIILVLKDGRLTDAGTHQDLRSRPGYYKAIADLQLVDDDDLKLLAAGGAPAS
jgi:ATP-binding cassette subfamily B protein